MGDSRFRCAHPMGSVVFSEQHSLLSPPVFGEFNAGTGELPRMRLNNKGSVKSGSVQYALHSTAVHRRRRTSSLASSRSRRARQSAVEPAKPETAAGTRRVDSRTDQPTLSVPHRLTDGAARQAPNLDRVVLHNLAPARHLSVPDNGDKAAFAHTENSRRPELPVVTARRAVKSERVRREGSSAEARHAEQRGWAQNGGPGARRQARRHRTAS